MGGVSAVRRRACVLGVLGAIALALGTAQTAQALEAFEGRIQAHGYFEEQIRAISNNFDEDLDLTQWYNIFNVELEADILPDGLGPISALSSFVRVEVRYDCVWTRGCGMFKSADVYGDRAGKLPPRLGDAEFKTYSGNIEIGPTGERLGANRTVPLITPSAGAGRRVGSLATVDGFSTLFGQDGFDNVLGAFDRPGDDPALYTFARYRDFRFAMRKIAGSQNGNGTQTLGPWLPKNHIRPIGALRGVANPFRGTAGAATIGCNPLATNPAFGDCNPVIPNPTSPTTAIYGNTGSGALPFRPAPFVGNLENNNELNAQGVYYPSFGLRDWLANGNPGNFDQNFSQNELAWNRGASQSQTKELKEAYLDAEFLDGQLWLRLGKQSIVWGKTELFATTDQFNPRDLALASLASLEETRINQWAGRMVLSLYNIGPLEDVRLEGAVNLDTFEPEDLGKCGEPYAPNPVCDKSYGLFAHGATGVALAGEQRPEKYWKDTKGLQGGARLEFRWDRFSFAVVDIYSYNRLPNVHRIWTYSRNVDPVSGRPVRGQIQGKPGSCPTGDVTVSLVNQPLAPGCLGVNPLSGAVIPGTASTTNEALRLDVLNNTSVNQQIFAMICSTTVGFAAALDPTVCAQSVFNSGRVVVVPIALAISGLLAGNSGLNQAFVGNGTNPFLLPTQALSLDPRDNTPGSSGGALSSLLSVQQEALLGCGPFYGYSCDTGLGGITPGAVFGIDLLNAEASALTQSFIGYEGTVAGWNTTDASTPQPGTVGFKGGSPCTRRVARQTLVLPGCRGPTYNSASFGGRNDYDPLVDGTTTTIGYDDTFGNPFGYLLSGHPFTGQQWVSEMAAFSWNLMMLLVGNSTARTPAQFASVNFLDPSQPFATTRCSLAMPQLCGTVRDFFNVTGMKRKDLRAGGNGIYGRRDFVWHSGGEAYLEYEKRNILGVSMDFAEDVTKSNWGVEMAWVQDLPYTDQDNFDGVVKVDTYNLTVSVDRPTFINFMNANRTFFFNSQVFFQYIAGYKNSFTTTGPWNFLGTFTISTGYFQDRLLPSVTFVYDVQSSSGAALPQIQYRYTENLSMTFGFALFFGHFEYYDDPINPLGTVVTEVGRGRYKTGTEQGLAVIRQRDEVFLRLRYTF